MNQTNIAIFSIVLGTVFTALDIIVLLRFQHFIRKHHASPWWYRFAWVVGGLAFALYVFVAVRGHLFQLEGYDLALFMAVCAWYLPKLPIAIVLLLSQVMRGLFKLLNRARTKPEPPTKSENRERRAEEGVTVSRRALLAKAAWSTAAVPYAMVANGMMRTLYDFQVTHEEVVLHGLPRSMDGFRLVQISDIHAGSFPDHRPFEEVVRLVRGARPDAVVITGDFVNTLPREMPVIAKQLELLAATNNVYATLGNHDHYNTEAQHRELVAGIRELGIDLLVNENRRIGTGGGKGTVMGQGAEGFVLAGIDNTGFKQRYGDVGKALAGVHPDEPTILLAHDPTFWDKEIVGKRPVNLMLSGHTHGGQVSVGAFGFGLSFASFVYEQVKGMYQKGDQLLYVNSGLGTVGPPLRVGVPPEVTVFTLRASRLDENLA